MTTFLTIFRRFPTTFRRFFPTFYRKLSEDFRKRTDDVSIIQQHILVLFKELCNHSNGDHFSSYGNTSLFQALCQWRIKKAGGRRSRSPLIPLPLVARSLSFRSSSLTESLEQAMATPISSYVKDKNSIFTVCDEDIIF